MSGFGHGDKVTFGRPNGEQTLGEVVGIGRTGKYKIITLESRGGRPPGVTWTVPGSLMTATDREPATSGVALHIRNLLKPFDFQTGQRVSWRGRDGSTYEGLVFGVNPRTVSIVVEGRGCWRVSPGLLQKV